jgi:hypothetical protein
MNNQNSKFDLTNLFSPYRSESTKGLKENVSVGSCSCDGLPIVDHTIYKPISRSKLSKVLDDVDQGYLKITNVRLSSLSCQTVIEMLNYLTVKEYHVNFDPNHIFNNKPQWLYWAMEQKQLHSRSGKVFEESKSVLKDASALFPLNVTMNRVSDFCLNKSQFALFKTVSTCLNIHYNTLVPNDGLRLQVAMVLSSYIPRSLFINGTDSKKTHHNLWVNFKPNLIPSRKTKPVYNPHVNYTNNMFKSYSTSPLTKLGSGEALRDANPFFVCLDIVDLRSGLGFRVKVEL